MTQHNIIGTEQSGPHVVVRQFAKPRPSRLRIAVIAVEFIAVAVPTIALWVALS